MICKVKLVRSKWISFPSESLGGEGEIQTAAGYFESVDLCEDIFGEEC